ncbi:Chromosome partition protein Smc [bacterium HR19]|nr:Chromosome partition protein Smc [bacterium HR19]
MIKKIEVKNFKSFKELEIELGKFNVLIGANASGKSNFVQIFQFLRDIEREGLENAISMQGGVEYLKNIKIGADEVFFLKVVSDEGFTSLIAKKEGLIMIKVHEITYEFVLKFREEGLGFEVSRDILSFKCKFPRLEMQKKKIEEREETEGEIIVSNVNGKVKAEIKPEEVPIKEDDIYPPFLKGKELPPNTILLAEPFFKPPIFSSISIYNFDPKLPKKATPITGKAELEEDGSNLSIVLKNIIKNAEKKRKLFNLLKYLLPFVSDIGVEKFADKSLFFKLQETYFKDYIPASLISDGTINIIALLVALYFEEKPLIIIEEPERNIHPYLISKVVDMMKDASQNKQIIITTHNPEIVKYAGLENILLVSRDKDGFSLISRPSGKDEVKIFLQNEIGIEELYVQNLL